MHNVFLMLVALAAIASQAGAQSPKLAELPAKHDKIVCLGDSITYQGDYVCNLTAYFVSRYPGQTWHVVNVGVSSETVSGLSEQGHAGGKFPRPCLHERLDRVMEQTSPDLIFACYGMNDGIYQPFDELRFAKFKEGMEKLHDIATKKGATIIHLTPPAYDDVITHNHDYVQVLERYSQWLLEQKSRGWQVIDVHGPMCTFLAEQRKNNPDFKLSKDGIHPTAQGHWLIARIILQSLGAEDVASAATIQDVIAIKNPKFQELIREQHELLRDAYITSIGTSRPGLRKGIAVSDAEAKARDLMDKIRAIVLAGHPAEKP